MADGQKVRVVRCPRCGNLLPEPPGISVYQCGGCATVLRAKKKVPTDDGSVDKLFEKKDFGSCEKLEYLSEQGGSSLGCASDSEWGSPIMEPRTKERVLMSRRTHFSNSPIRTDDEEDLDVYERRSEKETKGVWPMQMSADKEVGLLDTHGRFSEQRIENWVHRYNLEKDMNMYDSDSLITAPYSNTVWAGKSRAELEHQRVERSASTGYPGNSKAVGVADRKRVPNFVYPSETPSSSNSELFYGHHDAIESFEDCLGINNMNGVEPTHAELLTRLDELKVQIIRSRDLGDKPRVVTDRALTDPYHGRATYNASMRSSTQNPQHILGPHYFEGNRTFPLASHDHRNSEDFLYPPRCVAKGVLSYEDPFQLQMARKAHYPPTHQYPPQPTREHYPESFVNHIQDPLPSNAQDAFFHQPTSTCSQCSKKDGQRSHQAPNSPIINMGNPKEPIKSCLYLNDNPVTIGQMSSDLQRVNRFLSEDMLLHSRQPSELDSDIDGFSENQSRKVAGLNRNRKFRDAIAGGAPFVLCSSCLELLKLPRKLYKLENDWKKLQCGACSVVITVKVENKRLVIRFPVETKANEVSPDDGSPERLSANVTNFCLENSDSSSSKLTDTKHQKLSDDHDSNFGASERQELTSFSISSKEEGTRASNCALKDFSKTTEEASKDTTSETKPHSPFDEHFDHKLSKCREGSEIEQKSVMDVSAVSVLDVSFDDYSNIQVSQDPVGISKEEEIEQKSVIDVSFDDYSNTQVSQDSVEKNKEEKIEPKSVIDVSEVSVLDVSFDDYSNTQVSQNSVEVSKEEEDQSKISKDSDSPFDDLSNNNLREFSRSSEIVDTGRANVTVNGQPLPAHVVKKAEKQAGPILPGDYWYDYQAGFWGVIGHPCLGIIPPFIDEFTYPMPRNCAAGNTGIYVNGRELHKMDLDLLIHRGLPTTRDKFYQIDISGRVIDEDNGKEIFFLGKLAPTIEKVKHGFGMRVPRTLK